MRYRMPAEWQSQAATWLAWPHNQDTWKHNLQDAQAEFVTLARTIADCQPVVILCDRSNLEKARAAFQPIVATIEFVDVSTNDAWIRDYGPTFVRDRSSGRLVALDWDYNAWGGKYPPFDQDQQVAKRVANHLQVECVSPGLCFEGGAIEINDSGVVLCTKSCALDPNRNPGCSLAGVEQVLTDHLGATSIVWLTGDAIEGDDTNGHIDQLARFTDDQTIVYARAEDANDAQAAGLVKNRSDLETGLAASGHGGYRLIPLPLPEPVYFRGARTPASYCNFLITNEQVLVPQFGVAQDQSAIEILTPLFPSRQTIGLPSFHLSVGLGSFHCLSQQQPR